MKTIFFLLLFNIYQVHCFLKANICPSLKNIEIYQKFFFHIKSITVSVLQNEVHKNEIKDLTNWLILNMSTSKFYFIIEEEFLGNNKVMNEDFNIIDIGGHIVIVWNLEKLKKFLKTPFSKTIKERRGDYIIVILFHKLCNNFFAEISQILRQFWLEYGTMRVIAHTPCICEITKTYVLLPFEQQRNTWGVTKKMNYSKTLTYLTSNPFPSLNFNRFPVKISMFTRIPNVMKQAPKVLQYNPIYQNLSFSKNYVGIDAFLLFFLAKQLNFDPIIFDNREKEPFGRILSNGTIVGSLADVVSRRVHYSVNGRFIKNYGTKKIEFSLPYDSDMYCVVVPKAPRIPTWKSLYLCFDRTTLTLIFCTNLICTVIWYFIGPTKSISQVTLEAFVFIFGLPYKFNPDVPQFLFLVSCFIFSVIICGALQGTVYKRFTTITFYNDLNTLEDFLNSNLPLATNFWFLVEGDESSVIKKLRERVVPIHGYNVYERVAQGRAATFGRKQDIKRIIKIQYTDKDGAPLLHVIRQCENSFLIANIAPKGSPFINAFNTIIMRLFEAGLPKKWYEDVSHSIVNEATAGKKNYKSFTACTIYDCKELVIY